MTSRTTETAARIAGVLLLGLLAFAVLTQITNYSGAPLQESDRIAVEIPAQGSLPITETVDLKTGNVHLQIPIRSATKQH
jgi:hypothetical protein